MRKNDRELDKAIATIKQLLMSEGSELVHDGALKTVLKELESVAKGGKVERRRAVRIVAIVSRLACEKFFKR